MEWSFLASFPGHNLLPNKQASFSIIHPQILLSVIWPFGCQLSKPEARWEGERDFSKARPMQYKCWKEIGEIKRGGGSFQSICPCDYLLTPCHSNSSFLKVDTEWVVSSQTVFSVLVHILISSEVLLNSTLRLQLSFTGETPALPWNFSWLRQVSFSIFHIIAFSALSLKIMQTCEYCNPLSRESGDMSIPRTHHVGTSWHNILTSTFLVFVPYLMSVWCQNTQRGN